MSFKQTLKYSPNFDSKKRSKSQIKFLVFHYTGMKSDSEALDKLTNLKSKVSSHYFINKNGDIIVLVPNLYVAWHAGKSSWKNYNSLNKHSIGIEVSNPGHQYNYKIFSKKQIKSIIKLSKYLIKKYNINYKNIVGHSDIAPIRKKDPGEKFPWSILAKNKIGVWHSLSNLILKKNRLIKTEYKTNNNFIKNLTKIGYTFKNPKSLKKKIFIKLLIKAFQRRYRQNLVNGKIDKECVLISENLLKKLK